MKKWINQRLTKGLVVVIFHSLFQEFLQTEDVLCISTFKQMK